MHQTLITGRKTCNQRKSQENIQPVRNKACNLHKAQENMQLAHNTGKPLQTELL